MEIGKDIAAVVTGGASGLGAAVAEALAGAGARVAIFDMNEAAGAEMAEKLGGSFHRVDVADPESVAAGLKAAAKAHGPPRILVNCAGIGPAAKTVSRGEPHDPATFARTLGVNLIGTFTCASQARSTAWILTSKRVRRSIRRRWRPGWTGNCISAPGGWHDAGLPAGAAVALVAQSSATVHLSGRAGLGHSALVRCAGDQCRGACQL